MRISLVVAAIVAAGLSAAALAAELTTKLDLRNTVTGEPLNLDDALPDGRDTPGVKKFLETGVDPYIEDPSCLVNGHTLFLTACSGCHGEIGEGKIGPALNDDYWTYPKNTTDQGIFETVFGGARAQMGPHSGDATMDELLQIIAWVRHLYKDPVKEAFWLTDAQKKAYKPYNLKDPAIPEDSPGQCKAAAKK